ncbi:hypothetical protein ACIA8K_03600 [Catenuloplanes sp. NPDC051500]|uniref:hypothetical protein n=1 Tax=Catenuloplanes sp. NPDC051500 TaxID=3363959 RepID=UPI0037A1E72F
MHASRQQQPEPAPERPQVADLPMPVEGLCDLVLVRTGDGGLARPDAPTDALTAEQLTDYTQAASVAGKDLRILVDDGARNAKLLGRVAGALGCDILVAPVGATVERLAGPGGARSEAIPVDRVSGEVVEWVLVQPARLATTLPGWFDLAGGLVLQRAGLATLPLPGGLEFANREDFVVRRAAAARLGVGHPDLVTVALATRDGGFRLSTYRLDGGGPAQVRYEGRDVAAALSSIYLYGGDLRLWMRWPEDEKSREQLADQVTELADATGATVWTPAPGSEAVLLRGSRDLAARDRSGKVARWAEHRPPQAPETARFTTDRDGRLVPSGGPSVLAAGAVALISTVRQPEAILRERYADLSAEPGTALIDLTILDDGRLALRYTDGSSLAVGSAELRALLEGSGWKGEDLLLLTPVAPERASGLRSHLAVLEKELSVEIWSLPPDATIVVRDGLARAIDERQRPVSWHHVTDSPESSRWRNDDGWLIPRRRRTAAPMPSPVPAAEPVALLPVAPERVLPAPSPRPSLTLPGRGTRPHGVRWLADTPEVNAEPIRVWLSSPWTPQRVVADGVPSANLFLIGHLDGERIARANPQKHLLCLRVEAGGAVDLYQAADVPADLRHQAAEAGTFLLPAGWLDQARLQAGYRIDENGTPQDREELTAGPALLRTTGARHGTDGLPNEVVNWPRSERGGSAWVIIPEPPGVPSGDYLPLHQKRPAVRSGHRLVHVQVSANRAIDVAASAQALVGLTSVRSKLPELVAGGVTLLLPKRSFDRTRVDQVLHAENDKWKHRAKSIDLPLSSLLTPQPDAAP